MAARRFRYCWDDIAFLNCDYMAGWGAFKPDRSETIDFGEEDLPKLAFKMDADERSFMTVYQWPSIQEERPTGFIQSRIELRRKQCRFGGTRPYFICPSCGNATLRLAVLPQGLLCGQCGRVTWGSRRQRPLQRLMRKAHKIARRLECDGWQDAPIKKPLGMHLATFETLKAERQTLVTQIEREIARRLSRRRGGLLSQMAELVKIGA